MTTGPGSSGSCPYHHGMDATLDITLLRTLVAIREHGGFGRAAAVLRCSQPTVSQHVRVLERRLGQPLVEKDGRVARFTPIGERLLIEAHRIIAVHDEALKRLGVAGDQTRPERAEQAASADSAAELSALLRYIADRTPQILSGWETHRGE